MVCHMCSFRQAVKTLLTNMKNNMKASNSLAKMLDSMWRFQEDDDGEALTLKGSEKALQTAAQVIMEAFELHSQASSKIKMLK
eukprot:15479872-Alexandrium_andersonii.AAC.1